MITVNLLLMLLGNQILMIPNRHGQSGTSQQIF